MAFFSWPSRGSWLGYPADEATIQASGIQITQFLRDVATRSKAEAVHVIAHSMGNRAALESVREMARDAEGKAGIPFSQFILAAPDVDEQYFRQFAREYARVARRTTMYVSDRDLAVFLSKFVHGDEPRVGFTPPVTIVRGIDTIDVGKVDTSLLGHSYVQKKWQLLNDMRQMLHEDLPPSRRAWLEPRGTGRDEYWELIART
jgi:esterase/lipase superfamily enzyme